MSAIRSSASDSSRRTLKQILIASTALVAAGMIAPASAQTIWTNNNNTGDNQWATNTNWNTGAKPTAANNVFINSSIVNTSANPVQLNTNFEAANSLIVSNSNTLMINASGANGQLTVINGVNNSATVQLQANGVLTTGTGIANTGTLASVGTINSNLLNTSIANIGNRLTGNVQNTAGAFTVVSALTGVNNFQNSGTGFLGVTGGNFTGITTLTNSSTAAVGIQVNPALLLRANSIINNVGSTIVSNGSLTSAVNPMSNAGTFTTTGTFIGGVANAGTVNAQSTFVGNVSNIGSGVFNVTNTLNFVNTNFDNSGTAVLNVTGGSATGITALTNSSTAAAGINITGGNTLAANTIVNNTGATIVNAGTLQANTAPISNAGTITSTGTLTGGLANAGTVNAQSVINGAITNVNAGVFNVTGALTANSTFNNTGTSVLNVTGGNFTGLTTLTNSSTAGVGVNVAAARQLTANSVINNAGATIQIAGTLTTGSLTNSGTVTVLNGGTLNDDLNNAGVVTNNGTTNANVASNTGTITNNGTWNGAVASNTGAINNNFIWNGNIATSGTFGQATTGVLNGSLTNVGVASVAGVINGAIVNSGVFNVTGALSATSTVSNTGTGVLVVSGGPLTGITTLSNSSTAAVGVQINAGQTLTANNINNFTGSTIVNNGTLNSVNAPISNSGTITTTSLLTGGVTNAGTVNAQVQVLGAITNINSGVFTVTGNLAANSTFNNTGTSLLQVNGGSFTGITTLTNSSTAATGINITAGNTLTANNVITIAGSVTVNAGTLNSVNAPISNAGTLTTTSLVTGGIANSGTVNASGQVLGAITNVSSGVFNVTGNLVGNSTFANQNTAVLNVTGGNLTGLVSVTNSSTAAIGINIAASRTLQALTVTNNAGSTIALNGTNATLIGNNGITNAGNLNAVTGANILGGNVTNSGTIATLAVGSSFTINGNVANSGTLNMVAEPVGTPITANRTPITINGTLTGSGANTIQVAINLTTGVATNLVATGAATGTNNVVFNQRNTGAPGLFAPITITTTNTGSNTFVNGGGLPAAGLVTYSYVTNGPNITQVTATPNAGAATATMTSILSALSSIDASFHQSASALVASPQSQEPNKWTGGVWSRVSGGDAKVNSIGTGTFSGVASTPSASKTDTRFFGYQVGLDGGLLNVHGSGWNIHAGITAGQIEATTTELLNVASTVKFKTADFIGAYAVFTHGSFFSDVGYRHTSYNATVTNATAGLSAAPLTGTSNNINTSAGYLIRLPDNWYLEPSAGISWTQGNFSSLAATAAGTPFTLTFNTLNSTLGRLGLRAGTAFVVGDNIALSPFATLSAWHEFVKSATGTLVIGGNTANLATDRVGTFYQAGAGVSAQILNTGLLGFIRTDFRFGNKLNGWALLGGMRWTFAGLN